VGADLAFDGTRSTRAFERWIDTHVKLDASYVDTGPDGFDAANIEKVIRLRQLLSEFHKHPFLRGKLVLKGGTAINLFYFDLARLSVDIDLNYIGQLERELMLEERPEIAKAVEQVAKALGYTLQHGANDHALMGWYLGYSNHRNSPDRIEVEINFLMRACALASKVLPAVSIGEEKRCEFSVLAVEEVFAGKIKAMIDRHHPRDLYDLFRFGRANPVHDPELMRKLAVLFASTMNRDLRTYGVDRVEEIDDAEIKRTLYPLLRAGDRPTRPEMLDIARPILEPVLDHHREAGFLEAMAAGTYQPELLFPRHPEIVDRIRRHPALLWKSENVARYLSRRKAAPESSGPQK
jgi:predicted nucleotidyltransferase component of viral defense system